MAAMTFPLSFHLPSFFQVNDMKFYSCNGVFPRWALKPLCESLCKEAHRGQETVCR
jgi:hypothetical protein